MKWIEGSTLLAIDSIAHPKQKFKMLPREEMEARNKLEAEAAAEESKMILRWHWDFHRLSLSLPTNKYITWSRDVREIINQGTTRAKELEHNIGRFTHLGVVIPPVHHFMSRLRELHVRSKNRRSIKIEKDTEEDLRLMLRFLTTAHEGIDLNYIAFRKPTHVYRSDSCPYGLGG